MEEQRLRRGRGQIAEDATGHAADPADGVLRVVVTADNHLSAYTPRLSPQRLSERRRRLRRAFARVVDEAIVRRVHLFVQAGDLFDSIDPRNEDREFVAAQLARLRDAGIRAFGVSGNHDTPRQRTEHGGYSPQGVYARLGGLHYFAEFDRIQPVALDVAGLHVAVAGLSCNPGAAPGGDPVDGVELEDPDGVVAGADLGILLLHAAVEGHGFPGEDESIVRRASLARFPGFRLVLAGHVHAYARFQVGEMAVVVCGPTERMEFDEDEATPGFAYLEITRAGLRRAAHIEIPPQPRHVVTARTTELWPEHSGLPTPADSASAPDADGTPALPTAAPAPGIGAAPDAAVPEGDAVFVGEAGIASTPTEVILRRIEPYCTPEAMVRLRLEGPVTREHYRALDLRHVWLAGQRLAFSFEVDESGLFMATSGTQAAVARGERVAPFEVLEQVAREWMERAQTTEERAVLARTRERVLALYEHLRGREAGA